MSFASPSIDALAQLAQACRLGRVTDAALPVTRPTGWHELDAALPLGGWPVGALTELMPQTNGMGELRLAIPALAALSREQRYVAFVSPPFLPYPPALAQQGLNLERVLSISQQSLQLSLWATEQMLRCSAFGAVLLWCASTTIGDKQLRRLQLAAEAGGTMAMLYRPPLAAERPSPAALRLCLRMSEQQALRIEIKKCRGGRAGAIVQCALDVDVPSHRAA